MTCPAMRASASAGTNCAKPTKPRSHALLVSSYICQPSATMSICCAVVLATRAEMKCKKERCGASAAGIIGGRDYRSPARFRFVDHFTSIAALFVTESARMAASLHRLDVRARDRAIGSAFEVVVQVVQVCHHGRTRLEARHALFETAIGHRLLELVGRQNLQCFDQRGADQSFLIGAVTAVARGSAPGVKAFKRMRIDLVAVDDLVRGRLPVVSG